MKRFHNTQRPTSVLLNLHRVHYLCMHGCDRTMPMMIWSVKGDDKAAVLFIMVMVMVGVVVCEG